MDSSKRIAALREKMAETGLDAIVITRASNVDYITGFDGIHDEENPHAALITADETVFITDSRYTEVSGRQSEGGPWKVIMTTGGLIEQVAAESARRSFNKVGLEDLVEQRVFTSYQEKLSPAEVVATSDVIEKIRYVKSEEEIERIAAAQEIADAAFAHIIEFIEEGMTEREIALELEIEMKRRGAQALAFATIVAAGLNGALPHAVPGDRKVAQGDFITMDFGAQVGGYKSDMTRTVIMGEPTERQREIYETVLAANEASRQAVRAGETGFAIDKAGRDIIEAAGYGKNFGHGTGHGVGLDIHEGPNASPRSKDTFEAGDIITIEPGIYVSDLGGVRIEDLVVVTEDGGRVLSTSPRELIRL